MKPVFSSLAFAALLPIAPAHAADQMIGAWKVIDQGELCALQRAAGDSETFLIDNPVADDGIGFTSAKLKDIKDREPYKIAVSFSGKPAAAFITGALNMEGFDNGGPQKGFLLFGYPLDELVARDYRGDMIFKWNGRIVHRFPLDDLKPAMQALTRCADEIVRRKGIVR